MKFLEDQARKTGKCPASLAAKPCVRDELIFFWDAFQELGRARGLGMVPEPIKIADIEAWLNIRNVRDPEMRVQVYEIVIALDSEWMHQVDLKRKAEEENRKTPGTGS